MKHYLLACAFASIAIHLAAQGIYPPIIWNSGIRSNLTLPDEAGIDIYDIAVAQNAGSVYVAARCYSTCTFPNGQTITPEANGETLVLVKYTPQGSVEWIKNLGFVGTLSDGAKICASASNGVYIAGAFSIPQINFGNGITASRTCNIDCDELFIASFAANGQAQWARTINGNENTFFSVSGIETDQAGKLYLAGNYNGSMLRLAPNLVYSNLPGSSFFLATYDAFTGNPQLARFPAADSGSGKCKHLAVNNNGQAVLVGTFSDSLKFANGVKVIEPNDFTVFFVASLAASGNALWTRVLSSSDYADVMGIDIDEDGRAFLAIDASVDLKLDNGSILTITSTYAGSVLRLSGTGFSIPVFIECNTEDFVVMDVELDPLGNVYTAGHTSESLNIAGQTVSPDGCTDALLTATSSQGTLQWARTIGGAGCEAVENSFYASTIAFDGAGFLHAAGVFTGGFSEDGFTVPGSGAFVAKFQTGIVDTEEAIALGHLHISPNPNPGSFILRLEETPATNAALSVYDLGGREVFRQKILEPQTAINTLLPTGAYLLSLRNGPRLERQKLIVQR